MSTDSGYQFSFASVHFSSFETSDTETNEVVSFLMNRHYEFQTQDFGIHLYQLLAGFQHIANIFS